MFAGFFRQCPARSLAAVCFAWLSLSARSAPPVDFSREVLPILSEYCFQCHGPMKKRARQSCGWIYRKAPLEKMKTALRSLPQDKTTQSELIRRIEATDPDDVMPPAKSKHPLTPEQDGILKRWVEEGARWGRHWAFQRPSPPARPPVKKTGWARNEIDFHVLARLEREGLNPSTEASRETLIRRLGSGPDRPAADAGGGRRIRRGRISGCLRESSGSPARLTALRRADGWEWLDAARYADTNGYQGDSERTMWPWRDWVVKAFNANMPFDQFTIWQLAGDLLPNRHETKAGDRLSPQPHDQRRRGAHRGGEPRRLRDG